MQRLRIRYAKRGRLRFTSHRDFSRAFERALVRARIPMAYSSGFSPHPRISYAGASPTGAASEAEYLEIGLTARTDPEMIRTALDQSLPPGLDVLEVVESSGSALADRLQASCWRIELPGVRPAVAADAVTGFLAAGEVVVERMTKRGLRSFDCRQAVLGLEVTAASDPSPRAPEGSGSQESPEALVSIPGGSGEPCAILTVVLRHGTPSVRPDDVLAGLREASGLEVGVAALCERLAQGPVDERTGTVGDPLAPDRDAV